MTDSIHKQIIDAIAELLEDIQGNVNVVINEPVPAEVDEDGLIILRDLVPEPTEETLGGFDTAYVIGYVPVEVYVSTGEPEDRDIQYDELLQAVATALLTRDAAGQRRLGGLIFGLWADRPDPISEDVIGARPLKGSTIKIHLEYSAPTPLS